MPATTSTTRSVPRKPVRRSAELTRQHIFDAALTEFSQVGFGGARMDRIAKRAKCNIRMLYQHFGNKEQLYRSVLEGAYTDIREKESLLEIEKLDPIAGIIRLFEFTFDHFEQNPRFIALLTNENLLRGQFVLKTKRITDMTSPLVRALEGCVSRGRKAGLLSKDVDAVQLYVTIAALSWFHLSNAYTLSALFGRNLADADWRRERRTHASTVLKSYLHSHSGNFATIYK